MYKSLSTILQRFVKPATLYRYGFNWSPMYRRTTAKIIEVSDDLHKVIIRMKPSWKNRNYVGSIFGGSMLAATDPIYMIQLMQILGNDYVVWDKSVDARYLKPAKQRIIGEFIFTQKEITSIKNNVRDKHEIDLVKTMHLVDENQNKIATFKKTLYIANKTFYKQKIKQRQTSK